jgi:hypothetical protein
MIKIRIKTTNEIREVTNNIAHDLIDRGIAELATSKPVVKPQPFYENRQMNTFTRTQSPTKIKPLTAA